MSDLTERTQVERKGQQITLFVLWPGFLRMTSDEAVALAHLLLEEAFAARREAARSVGIDLTRRDPTI